MSKVSYARSFAFLLLVACALGPVRHAAAQPQVAAWGNVEGIRIDGQLMEFETSLRVVDSTWTGITRTAKERQRPRYRREGDRAIVSTRIDSLFFTKAVRESGRGRAVVDVEMTSRADTNVAGVYFAVALPAELYGEATVELIDPSDVFLETLRPGGSGELLHVWARGARLVSPRRTLEVTTTAPTQIVVRERNGHPEVYLAISHGPLAKHQEASKTFTIAADGEVDRRPITLAVDASRPGRAFDGLGGNFRIQNPRVDPPVIRYNLDNLRVAWSRVDMPWHLWHPEEHANPAEADSLHPQVRMAMEMAQELDRRGIPVMAAAWWGPEWALLEDEPHDAGRLRGDPLDPDKMDAIYASITSYITYLRDHFGVEIWAFSFNESDLGIDIRQTAEEHRELIKGLGAYFASKGLDTKLLLGDTADANGYEFMYPAMADSATHPYIAAVSFHSWRGWAPETLEKWDEAATQLGVPLIVGEGSIDAAAWRYPQIFEEPSYALEEINLYTRIVNHCEPMTILQWQLTADYSLLAGGGVFGNHDEPLRPTQRFWNLKQLGSTPPGLPVLPVEVDRPYVTAAALGDDEAFAVHLVNNGTTRDVVLTGLPETVSLLQMFVTDAGRAMEEGRPVPVTDGEARFTLESQTFTTLLQRPPQDAIDSQ